MRSAEELLKASDETFSLKKVAAGAATSTQMIYTLFGGKRSLLAAVYQKQSDLLKERLLSVKESDPLRAYWKLAYITRRHYLENKKLHDTLFSMSSNRNKSETIVKRTEVFDIFKDELRKLQEKELLRRSVNLDELGESMWTASNGLLRFQTLGFFQSEEEARERYQETLLAILRGNSPQPDKLTVPEDLSVPAD
jgi:AcrR family transcriptional regulator